MEIATKATYSCLPLKYALGSKDTMLTINREKNSKRNLTSDLAVRMKADRVKQVKNVAWALTFQAPT